MNNDRNDKIKTKWYNDINLDCPLGEYPRPQLKRDQWQCLNGIWDYSITDIDSAMPEHMDGKITVPYAVESALSGVCQALLPSEKLHYKRKFAIGHFEKTHRIILHFEAVDWNMELYINGSYIGSNQGGYIPFSFDITDHLIPGENELYAVVTDPTDTQWQQRGKQVLDPMGIWYTATSGIWQTVWLESVPPNHISSVKITSDISNSEVIILIETKNSTPVKVIVKALGKTIADAKGFTNNLIKVKINSAVLWSPENPFLYDVIITTDSDSVSSYFGMRSISIGTRSNGRNRILLNGQPVFLNGPLDQGYWPESGMTQPCDDAVIFDLQSVKDLGFNAVRKHIKIESQRWYYHADRIGLMVIQDMPNGGKGFMDESGMLEKTIFGDSIRDDYHDSYKLAGRSSFESRENFEVELYKMTRHLHNHPSIVIWCPFNESWGQFDSWRIFKSIKNSDPSRLVDHASGWHDQGCGDFLSIHTYVHDLKSPPLNDKRAYFISEYGGYNFIDKDHLWRDNDVFGYRYFDTIEELMDAYEHLIIRQVLPLIEKGLCGVIYTQLSDVEIETNGLFTYDRKVLKFDNNRMKALHKRINDTFNLFNT